VVGLVTSVISFPSLLGLSLALFLLALEQLLENAVFVFVTMFLQPIPESYRPSDWLGMTWGYPTKPGLPFIVGLLFDSEENAKKIFGCIRSWNYGSDVDSEDNIKVSAVIEDQNTYTFYFYPSPDRKAVSRAMEKARGENPTERQVPLVMQVVFCKAFDFEGSSFQKFKDMYTDGEPFLLKPYVVEEGNLVKISKPKGILKRDLKIKTRQELARGDLEYEHGRFVINTDTSP